jgi:hypothetical protein
VDFESPNFVNLSKVVDQDVPNQDLISTELGGTPDNSAAEETIKRSTVKTLRGILKKPRRYSKESKIQECEKNGNGPAESNHTSSSDGIIPEISSQHSDEKQSRSADNTDTKSPSTGTGTTVPERLLFQIPHGSLQMAAFDRLLFAKRGAELRDEYMRDFHSKIEE